ncbi:integral membrane plasmid transfer protein [Streptomyces sp. NA02950]|uniref:Pycsar system effector family protein n=1 Tax=Streptomyces sp. NA02950 TaxID=2742137 RepID=UPI00158FDA07|nr:Pycsar system effector family protein [Streptomyces sp. NA02950]QKV93886.1 integral membrane plasmid transfer protein [Streptomyces sp. NA02950]
MTPAVADDVAVAAALAEVKAEIARTDSKASVLLAFNGALMAGVWTVATSLRLPPAALAVGAVGVGLLVAAAAVLLAAARPNLGGAQPKGFPLWATLPADQLRAALAGDDLAERVTRLSQLAVGKFARLQRAVDYTRAAGAAFITAALVAAVLAMAGGAR